MRRFYLWCARAWPFWAILLVIGVHQGSLMFFSENSENISKGFSAGLQVIGGLLVLQSIDSALGILRGSSISSLIIQWLRTCPAWYKHKVVTVMATSTASATASIYSRVHHKATSLSSRVTELERQIAEVHQEMERREQALIKIISDTKDELIAREGENAATIRDIERKINVTALGSIKKQAFGVVIAMYGAGIGYFY